MIRSYALLFAVTMMMCAGHARAESFDIREIMGGGDGHYNAWYKYDLDWFNPSEVGIAATSQQYRVYDLAQPHLRSRRRTISTIAPTITIKAAS